MTLDQITIGDSFVIDTITAQGEIRQRLIDMGFIAGARGTVLRKALLGDPLELRLGSYRIALRKAEAQHIHVAQASG